MPASYKAAKAKSCLRRNIFNGLDVEEGPKNYPVQKYAKILKARSLTYRLIEHASNGAQRWIKSCQL